MASIQRIEDFGERIEGARKHLAAQRWADALPETDSDGALGFAALWPIPPYERMITEGSNRWLVAFAHALRDLVPNMPRGHRHRARALRARWATRTVALRTLAAQALREEIDPLQRGWLETVTVLTEHVHDVTTRTLAYHTHGHRLTIANVRFARLAGSDTDPEQWVMTRGERAGGMIRIGKPTQGALVSALGEADLGTGTNGIAKPRCPYEVRRERVSKRVWITRRATGDHARLIECPTSDEAHRIITEERERCDEAWTRWRAVPAMRPPRNRPRIGEPREIPPITPETFTERFALRGVQFGNWVELGRREDDLVRAYLALWDLAVAIQWPTRALSLQGRLGLAFGARGNGGRNPAAAHYEPTQEVINLTKRHGAGSLAHEWWHAFDNAMAKHARALGHGCGASFATEARTDAADDTIGAMRGVATAIRTTAIPQRSRVLDKRRRTPYWSTMCEMTARAFERHVCDALAREGIENDYLAAFRGANTWNSEAAKGVHLGNTYPYPTPDEAKTLAPAFERALAHGLDRLEPRPAALERAASTR